MCCNPKIGVRVQGQPALHPEALSQAKTGEGGGLAGFIQKQLSIEWGDFT